MVWIKTAELIGEALDWAVGECEGLPLGEDGRHEAFREDATGNFHRVRFAPSTDGAFGSSIVECQRISARTHAQLGFSWVAFYDEGGSTAGALKKNTDVLRPLRTASITEQAVALLHACEVDAAGSIVSSTRAVG